MKLSRSKLKQIINEEISHVLFETRGGSWRSREPASGEYETGQSEADKRHSRGDSGAVRETWTSNKPVLIVLADYLFDLGYPIHSAMEEYHDLEGFAQRKVVDELMWGLKRGEIDGHIAVVSRVFGEVTREDIAAAIEELQSMV